MQTRSWLLSLIVLLLVLGILAVTHWVPILLFLPAGAAVLLAGRHGAVTNVRSTSPSRNEKQGHW